MDEHGYFRRYQTTDVIVNTLPALGVTEVEPIGGSDLQWLGRKLPIHNLSYALQRDVELEETHELLHSVDNDNSEVQQCALMVRLCDDRLADHLGQALIRDEALSIARHIEPLLRFQQSYEVVLWRTSVLATDPSSQTTVVDGHDVFVQLGKVQTKTFSLSNLKDHVRVLMLRIVQDVSDDRCDQPYCVVLSREISDRL
ncbi:hypothetical protein HG530_014530 [Fusarium avenaceum]|nr:hypothetical protein HG530_014530 [Fusarium avenaceum]